MKTKLFLLVSFLSINLLKAQNNIAVVNKIQGFYIFTDSQPLADYDVTGEVTTQNVMDPDILRSAGQYQPTRDYLIRIARQTNYLADGLILSLVNGGVDKAIVIKFKENAPNKSHAKVNQYQGVYIFTDCEPLTQTKYLGSVQSKISFSGAQYQPVRDKLLKRCKKDYPQAKGLVLKLVSGGADIGDAVEFEK